MATIASKGFVCVLGALSFAPTSLAHHSSIGIYDEENPVEIEGVVTEVRWRNPHPSFTIAVSDGLGDTVDWQVETGSISTLRLRGIDRDFIRVGDRVHFAGQSSLRGLPEMFAENMLLDDGREVLLRAVSRPYWPAGLSGNVYERSVNEEWEAEGRRAADGIFRVWTPIFDDPAAYPLYSHDAGPLTAEGAAIKARYRPRDSDFIRCQPKAMPYIMASAYPIEFTAQGDDILLKVEEFDTERLIHMNEPIASLPEEYTRLGFARGHWDGGALVVETERIEASLLYTDGTPTSRAIRLTERFAMNEAGDRLNYTLTIDDPDIFTERLEFTRYWVWQPDIRLQRYDCGNIQE